MLFKSALKSEQKLFLTGDAGHPFAQNMLFHRPSRGFLTTLVNHFIIALPWDESETTTTFDRGVILYSLFQELGALSYMIEITICHFTVNR